MKFFRYFGVSLDSIMAHKLRASLTMLGIIIGVAAVLITVGIGSGAAVSITEQIESSGTNLLTISAGGSGRDSTASTFTLADAAVFADTAAFPDIAQVAPQYASGTTLSYGGTEGTYQVVGTTANYAAVTNTEMAEGEFLSAEQVEDNANVAVLGATVATDLFGSADPLGQTLRIDTSLFQVIGVLEESGGFGGADSQAYVPIEVAQGRLFNAARYRGSYTITTLSVQVTAGDLLDAVESQIEQMLRLRHGLDVDDANDFQIRNQADMLEMEDSVSGTLTALLGGIGAISLLVGGIGIMNIMLVSVTERTREIGLRKAVGAHNSDVLMQFLVEALVLCTLGGLVGIALSYAVAFVTASLPAASINIVIEPWALAMALGVSTASGFLFGLYPAMRATQLDPIEALRYD